MDFDQIYLAHRTWLLDTIPAVPQEVAAAFAACCAERLYPALPRFERKCNAAPRPNVSVLRQGLDAVWDATSGFTRSTSVISPQGSACKAAIPTETQCAAAAEAAAEDAGAAIAYAVMALETNGTAYAAWAGVRGLDALDAVRSEDVAESCAVLLREIERQRRDLLVLQRAFGRGLLAAEVQAARSRAVAEAS